MGSLVSYHSSATNSTDGLNISNASSSRVRKSKRLIEKFSSPQSSTRSDEVPQTSTNAIDLVLSYVAQNPTEGEIQNKDHLTADTGE